MYLLLVVSLVLAEPVIASAETGSSRNTDDWQAEYILADDRENVCSTENVPDEESIFLVESRSEMEASLPEKLSGKRREDLVSVARSQLGYTACVNGYTRYADWCLTYAADWEIPLPESWRESEQVEAQGSWDAAFVCFCLYYADIPVEQLSPQALTEGYSPVPGDLVFLELDETSDEGAKMHRIAIVSEVLDEGRLSFVMGDAEGTVKELQTSLEDETIRAFAVLPVETMQEKAEDNGEFFDLVDEPADDMSDTSKPKEPAPDEAALELLGELIEVLPAETEVKKSNADGAQEEAMDREEKSGDGIQLEMQNPPEMLQTEERTSASVLNSSTIQTPAIVTDTYALAPSGYVLLRVKDDLAFDQTYVFDGRLLYYTQHQAFLGNASDDGAFVLLIPEEYTEDDTLTEQGAELLIVAERDREDLHYSSDINEDGLVNIADANALYQMIQNGGDYYSIEQVSLEARLRLQYENLNNLNVVMNEING